MSYRIVWSPDAITTFEDRIRYLTIHWTDKEIHNFKKRVNEYLVTLSEVPFIGKPGSSKNLHIGLILKEVSLIYRVKSRTREVELVLFFDNRQDPKRIKKYKS